MSFVLKYLQKMFDKTIEYSKSYVAYCIWLLIFAIVMRFFETLLLCRSHGDFSAVVLRNLTGFGYDVALYLRLGILGGLVFIAACFLSEKYAKIILRILQSLMLLLSLTGIVFFATSGFLLDRIVFAYSIEELWGIILSSSQNPVWVYFVVAGLPVLYFLLSSKKIKIRNLWVGLFAALTALSFFILKYPENGHSLTKTNKAYFFVKSVLQSQNVVFEKGTEEILNDIKDFRSYFPEHQFKEFAFPFLYQTENHDVLSSFFTLNPEPPNFVLIIVEGLDKNFLNPDYQIMPFLDSLSKKSLTWEYCLSASAKTFGVLPALLGTAPLGEKGFMALSPNNPEYLSLPRILHQNNYTNRFFYGGWVGFDNMNYFFDSNNTSYLKKEDEWDQDITKQKIGTFWGYEDHLTYLQAHRILSRQTAQPRMDIYLSLSTHDPFEYPRSSYFENIVREKTKKNEALSEQQKNDILNKLKIYGSFAYSDWAIQQLIEDYRKRDDFENTIFIITGDHSVFSKQFGGVANYHVPLIIYSPMLKSGRNMKGVVSHRDITPTLLSLLQNNYDFKSPQEVTWLNTALDTSLTFRANTFSPLQIIHHAIDGVLYKNYMLCEGVLEEISDKSIRKINNPDIAQKMNKLLRLYQSVDLFVLQNETLIRNFSAYKPKESIIDIKDSVAEKSYYAKKTKLPIEEGPQGYKTTLHFNTADLYPIEFLNFDIPDRIEQFAVEVEFKIYIQNNESDKTLSAVMDLEDSIYKRDVLYFDKQNRWYVYKNKEYWYNLKKTSSFKLYLWNNDNLEGYIDDIKVKIEIPKD